MIRTFVILAPVVETGWEPVLREVKRANIPKALVDRGIKVSDDSPYATHIASDFVQEGRLAAEWLAKKLNAKGNIVELQGTPGAAPAIDRKKGLGVILEPSPARTKPTFLRLTHCSPIEPAPNPFSARRPRPLSAK